MVDDRQLAQDLEYIAIGQKEGAKLHGGEALSTNADGAPGFYLRPALFTETTPEMRINREEIFGPVVSIQRVKSYDEAWPWPTTRRLAWPAALPPPASSTPRTSSATPRRVW